MSIIAIDSNKNGGFGFFDCATLNYLLPEIQAISEMQSTPHDFTKTGRCFVFNLYLTHGVSFEVGFDEEAECRNVRKDLINHLLRFLGPDKLIFANGYDCEIVLVSAVFDVTAIFIKDQSASFSLSVASVPFPIHLIFPDQLCAERHYQELLDAIEMERRQACATLNQHAANC